jgi:serine/threonine protein phosphatase PrpC
MRQKTDFYSGVTHTGKVRDNNEDAFVVERILDGRYILACVIDGVGGYEGGEVAARIARDSILNHLQKTSEDLFLAIREAVVLANEKIYAEKIASDRNTRMACVLTLAVIDLTYNQFYYAHVGDTRLYLLRDHTLVKITRDDSFVGFLEDSKRISEEEAMKHPKRNEISKALGFDPNIGLISDYIETGISPFLPGDILLLCSDGLTDMIDSKTITRILTAKQKVPEKAKALVDAANNAGGKDNVTVVLLHNTNQRTVLEATKPAIIKKNEKQTENDDAEPQENGLRNRTIKSNRGLITLLILLCLGLLAALLWQVLQSRKEPVIETATPQVLKNDSELKLQENLRGSSVIVLNDSIYGQPLFISDTIFIDRDSVRMDGNNLVLQSRNKEKSAAFMITPACRYILFENMVFKDFEKAVITQNSVVQLRNVRFQNCDVAVEHDYRLPQNIPVSGSTIDTLLFKTDSVAK